jgi:hypothetical protein
MEGDETGDAYIFSMQGFDISHHGYYGGTARTGIL